jgi:UDP-glucose 4-epimerase
VVGATTPLGAALVQRLLDDPDVEHVLEVGAEPYASATPRLSYRRVDLTRERAVHDLVHGVARGLAIDAVVHLALHRSARDEGARVHARNVEATRQLLRCCAEVPTVRRFVFQSTAAVYALRSTAPALLDEDAALEFDPGAGQWIRDRVEADLTVCARMGMSPMSIVVLRTAEILAPGMGSQLWDYLQSRVCLRPLGFDPMINVLSLVDAVDAIRLALGASSQGVFNIAGADTLPLSRLIERWGRRSVPVPGPLLAPLYRLRAWSVGLEFRYDLNLRRFHTGGQVDDTRARAQLGYGAARPTAWPRPAADDHSTMM